MHTTNRWPRKTLPQRVAMLSVHTSPLDQPGVGDAGGLNVYVVELSRRLAAAGIKVEVFTRAKSRWLPSAVELEPGVIVRHLEAGPYEDIRKDELPAHLCAFTTEVLRAEASQPGHYFDLVHSHYWLSGQVGAVAGDRWNVPHIHSPHTMALVKNAQLAAGDSPEPHLRVVGEEQVITAANHLIANTDTEAADLIDLYGARPDAVSVVHPGVDLDVFTPGDKFVARRRLGIDQTARMLLFVGRIQPLKAPDVFIQAVAELAAAELAPAEETEAGPGATQAMAAGAAAAAIRIDSHPTPATEETSPLVAVLCGGASGPGPDQLGNLRQLAQRLGVADAIQFEPPASRARLASWYRAADLVCVPSHSESFGLVAAEAQACGTPVVAAAVGGLLTCVRDGISGVLINGHDPTEWAREMATILADQEELALMGKRAREHAESFGWENTATRTLEIYRKAINTYEPRDLRSASRGATWE